MTHARGQEGKKKSHRVDLLLDRRIEIWVVPLEVLVWRAGERRRVCECVYVYM